MNGENTRQALRARHSGWRLPLAMLAARSLCWIAAQAAVAVFFLAAGRGDPWNAAAPWWSVYGILANLGCLGLLLVSARREGIGFAALTGRLRLGRDLWLAAGAYMVMAAAVLMPAVWINRLMFGLDNPPMYPGLLSARDLPFWAVIVSFAVFAPLNALIEETAYQGYVLARLDAVFRRRWLAPVLVAFFWAAQHAFLPFILDWQYAVWRFLYFFLGTLAFTLLYLLIRRLPPLILAHAAMDALAVFYTLRF